MTTAGSIVGCLTGPSAADPDLSLQKNGGSSWDVYAYSGSDSFMLRYDLP